MFRERRAFMAGFINKDDIAGINPLDLVANTPYEDLNLYEGTEVPTDQDYEELARGNDDEIYSDYEEEGTVVYDEPEDLGYKISNTETELNEKWLDAYTDAKNEMEPSDAKDKIDEILDSDASTVEKVGQIEDVLMTTDVDVFGIMLDVEHEHHAVDGVEQKDRKSVV